MHTELIRRHPVNGLINSFFDDAFFAPKRADNNGESWVPPVDLSQTEDHFLLRADLPGLSREDIEILVEDRTLTLTGSRSFEARTAVSLAENEDVEVASENGELTKAQFAENFSRIERSFGTFTRTFQLPTNVDTGKVSAVFDNGVLTLEIAKSEQAKTRKIEIS